MKDSKEKSLRDLCLTDQTTCLHLFFRAPCTFFFWKCFRSFSCTTSMVIISATNLADNCEFKISSTIACESSVKISSQGLWRTFSSQARVALLSKLPITTYILFLFHYNFIFLSCRPWVVHSEKTNFSWDCCSAVFHNFISYL